MSTDENDPQAPGDPVRSLLRRVDGPWRPRWSRVTWIAVALIAAQMVLRTWATSRSWFMWDDYIFLADVARGDTSVAWLFHSHFSLVQPVAFAIVWAIGGVGLNWTVIGASIVLLQLGASLSCWWMLRVLFGNRMLIVLPLLFYLFSPLTAPSTVWWSVAIYQYPHQIAIFGAVAAHVMYMRSGRWRHLALAAAFLTLGLGSYLKAPLITLILLGISWLWFTDGPWRARIGQLARAWRAWLIYGALTAGYVVLWATRVTDVPARRNCELPGVLQNSMFDTLATSVVGGPLNWRLWTGGIDPFIAGSDCVPQAYRGSPDLIVGGAPQSLASPSLTVVVLACLLIGFLVLHRWSRHVNALRSLWLLVPYAALSAGLVFAGRAATWGSQVSAREVRYFSDVAVIIALGLGTALMPIVGARVGVRPREEPYITKALSPTLVRTLVLVFILGSVTSTITYVLPWHNTIRASTFPERNFLEQVERDLAATDAERIDIVDLPLPVTVANPVIFPYNLPSRKLAPLTSRLRPVQQGNDLQVLDDEGRLRPATIPDAPRAAPGPVDDCGYLVQGTIQRVEVSRVVPGAWWTRVDYLASDDGVLEVQAGPMSRRVPVERGLHQMLFLTDGNFGSLWLRAEDPSLSVCVDNVHVGPVQPQKDPA